MTLEEKIRQYAQQLPHSSQQKLLDFAEYLIMKAEHQEKRAWNSLSLASTTLPDLEVGASLYGLSDVKEVFTPIPGFGE